MRYLSLALLFVVSAAHAEDRVYLRTTRQYVIAPGQPVEARCDDGDELVKGDCWAGERGPSSSREPQHGYLLSSVAIPGAPGWRCETDRQDVRQTLLIVARVSCQKK